MDNATMAAWAVAGLALLAAICWYLATAARCTGGRSRRRYPPVVGTVFHKLYHFRRLHDYLTDLSRGRKTFRLLAPGRRVIYTCDPAVVEHILRAKFANYGKGSFNRDNTGDLLGDGIFAVDGDRWRQQRKIAGHEFATRAMREFSGAVFRENAARLAAVVSVRTGPPTYSVPGSPTHTAHPRSHTSQAVGPQHTCPNAQQRVLGLLGQHSPKKLAH
ncbi:hypothetical protein U9M48_016861 [Paspalum notatum var. saurae]|uniref:Cytochrome P450 n=1 Tax=Paspalum notatum var. saurae TaxID=547442 RepID=A0AAQ3TAD0_PASNO